MPNSPNTNTTTSGSPSPLPDEPPPPKEPPPPPPPPPPNPPLPRAGLGEDEGQREHRAASIETASAAGKPVVACRMPLRLAASISVVAALIALPAAADAANVVRPSSVGRTDTLTAGTHTLHAPVPVTVGGAERGRDPEEPGSHRAPLDSRQRAPATGASGSRSRTPASRVRSVLRCVRLEVPAGMSGARLEVKTRRQPGVAIPAGGATEVAVRCGSAWVATGYGLDAGASGNVRLASVVPVAHGWNFVLENVGLQAHDRPRAALAASGGRRERGRLRRSCASTSHGRRGGTSSGRTAAPRSRTPAARAGSASPPGSIVDPRDCDRARRRAGRAAAAGDRWTFRNASGGDSGADVPGLPQPEQRVQLAGPARRGQ